MFMILDEYSKRPDPVLSRFFAWFKQVVKALDDRVDSIDYSLVTVGTADKALGKVNEKDVYADRVHYRLVRPADADFAAIRWLKERWGLWFRRRFDGLVGRPNPEIRPLTREGRLERRIKPEAVENRVRQLGLSWTKTPSWRREVAVRVRAWLGLEWPKSPSLSSDAIAEKVRGEFARQLPEAMITVLGPPPVRGVGRAGGFKIMVEDRGDNGSAVLQGQTDGLNDNLKQDPRLTGMTSVFRANVPSIFVDVNRTECMSKEVPLQDLFDTLRVFLGSRYVNDFNKFGRTWQVIVQADATFRNSLEGVRQLKVRNSDGTMVPIAALADIREINGPLVLTRYNMYPAAPLNGAAAAGVSSGDAIKIVQSAATDPVTGLAPSMSYEWTELAFLELQAGNTAMIVFGFAVVMVFLVLAAQYESWSLPLAVILVVPMCLLSAVAGVKIAFQDINIFTQIGFVVLVGLASKNAILIVEFAKARRDEGETREQAALDACRLRLRPIVMTSLAFILGVLPLIMGHGAGAEMRRTLGMTVFSGMLGVTAFGIFLTPVFFSVVDRLGSSRYLHSGPIQKVSTVLLAVLTFGLLTLVRELSRRRAETPRRPRPIASPTPAEERPGELVEHK
jgi:multidrug efflux pump